MIEMLGMETPEAPRPDPGTGELLMEAAWLAGGAAVLVAVAVVVEALSWRDLWRDFKEGRF
jgi:hypothetical protein